MLMVRKLRDVKAAVEDVIVLGRTGSGWWWGVVDWKMLGRWRGRTVGRIGTEACMQRAIITMSSEVQTRKRGSYLVLYD